MNWIPVVSVTIALAAGAFAYERHRTAEDALAQLDGLKTAGDQARADLLAARSERATLVTQVAELRDAVETLRTDLDAQHKLLDAEKANSIRLQEDLAMTRSRLAAASARPGRSADALPPGLLPVQRPPMTVRIAPGAGAAGNAAANAVPAR